MSDNLLGKLKDAWGVQDDGPDASTMSGLMQLAESWLENEENEPQAITHHFETMKNRVVGAHMERSQALDKGDVQYDRVFADLVEKNLADMESVEHGLDMFIEGANSGDREACWDALGELEGAHEAVKESGGAIAAFMNDSPLVCMACGSIGEEAICAKCNGERLKLDPDTSAEEERAVSVSEEVLEVYEAYDALVNGQGPMTALVTSLQSLEFTYLEVEAIAKQTLENEAATDQIKETAKAMVEAIGETLKGIALMHSVQESRVSADLRLGWRQIFESSVKAGGLLGNLNAQAETLE